MAKTECVPPALSGADSIPPDVITIRDRPCAKIWRASEPFDKNSDAIAHGYEGRYAILKDRVDKWFAQNGPKLGDALAARLRAHFEIKGVPGAGHENIVSKSRGIEEGLKR